MSTRELSRLEVVQRVLDRRLSQRAAATSLGISYRQMKRLVARYRVRGPQGLISGKRGQPGNHRLPAASPRRSSRWFGSTTATSGRLWPEDRGPVCTVLSYVDDATSRLQLLRFVEGESTFDYMQATRTYLERYGKPLTFYSDKHTVFHVSKRSAVGGTGMTQYGRALHELSRRELQYRQFDRLTHVHQGEVVSHKRLGSMLVFINEKQKALPTDKRSIKCPTRRYPTPAQRT